MLLTLFERWHGKNTRKHALVVTIQHTADTGKGSQAEDAKVLDKSASSAVAHEGLAAIQRCIVDGSASVALDAHCEDVFPCFLSLLIAKQDKIQGY